MTVWATPWAFMILVPLAAVAFWMWWARRRRTATIQFSQLSGFLKVHRGYRSRLAWLPLAIKVLAIGCAIVALARPQKADTKIKRNVEGIDIMIVFDISDSMLIEDMDPVNRIESAKDTMSKFIKQRVSDRIGLIVFAGESYTRVPMTLDYPMLLKNISEVETAHNMKMGTAIGVGLANGIARIKDSTAKSRVIILMTDGENNTGVIDPDTAIEMAKGYDIKIYSIGLGRDGESQLPVYMEDVFGRKVKRYRPIHSDVNTELLEKMAKETGGKSWRATNGDALRSIFKEINGLEKTNIETSQFTRYAELFPPWLKWSVVLYFLAVFMGATVLRKGP
ncbi:MAG: vWA domain-containing protein [Bdellovibrionales bacterium]